VVVGVVQTVVAVAVLVDTAQITLLLLQHPALKHPVVAAQ
jgi:hypothetical protein